MRFAEQYAGRTIGETEPQLGLVADERPALLEAYGDCTSVAVNLLPAHPFQYVAHRAVQERLVPNVVDGIRTSCGLDELTFIANRRLKKAYQPLFDRLSCRVIYTAPSYPFSLDGYTRDSGPCRIIDWFEFVVLAEASLGKRVTEFPVSATYFAGSGTEKRQLTGPLAIGELAELFEVPTHDHVFTDHPFAGAILPVDARLTGLDAREVLVFPKGSRERTTLLSRVIDRFVLRRVHFRGGYDTTDAPRNLPCSKCLKCVAACPVDLHPFMLSAIAERGNLKDAAEFNAHRCVECGLCSYVCPSDIPLMTNIVKLKKEL